MHLFTNDRSGKKRHEENGHGGMVLMQCKIMRRSIKVQSCFSANIHFWLQLAAHIPRGTPHRQLLGSPIIAYGLPHAEAAHFTSDPKITSSGSFSRKVTSAWCFDTPSQSSTTLPTTLVSSVCVWVKLKNLDAQIYRY